MLQVEAVDVLVVGARVAGAVTAALLGDGGCRVLLIDRDAFPSPTLSTHYFRGNGMVQVLDGLGIYDEVMALAPPPLTSVYHFFTSTEDPAVRSNRLGPRGHSLSVRREPLDALLVRRAARSPSVTLRERTRLTEVICEAGRVAGARLTGPEGEYEVRCRFLVGADGRHSLVARAVAAPAEESEEGHRGGYYRYVRGFVGPTGERDGAEFSLVGDEMAYVFPSDDGVTCVAISVALGEFARMKRDPERRFEEQLARHTSIYRRYRQAAPEGKLFGYGPHTNYLKVPVGPGWALVGDAALYQDFFSGLGMDCGSIHAAYLAEAILAALTGNQTEAAAIAEYHRRRNEHALPLYRQTVALSRDLRQLLGRS